MDDLYDKIKEDVEFRTELAEQCGFGFESPQLYRIYQESLKKLKQQKPRK